MLWGASVPTSDRGLPKSNFRYLPYQNRRRARPLQRYRNRHPKPKSRAPGTGGVVGVVGHLGLLWGASVPTSDRGLPKSRFSFSALPKSSAGAPASTPQKPNFRLRNRPPQAQIEVSWQRKVRGCRGAAGVALGCFGSDPNRRAASGYQNQILVICLTILVRRPRALQRHRNRISGCQIARLGGRGDSTSKTLP